VTLPLPPEETGLLTAEEWTELAIVSRLEVVGGAASIVPRPVEIALAPGAKCARCWRVLEEVGRQPAHPTLCLRCADAVDSGLVCRPAAAA
jgi:isoleucyl-tRNA synthetase